MELGGGGRGRGPSARGPWVCPGQSRARAAGGGPRRARAPPTPVHPSKPKLQAQVDGLGRPGRTHGPDHPLAPAVDRNARAKLHARAVWHPQRARPDARDLGRCIRLLCCLRRGEGGAHRGPSAAPAGGRGWEGGWWVEGMACGRGGGLRASVPGGWLRPPRPPYPRPSPLKPPTFSGRPAPRAAAAHEGGRRGVPARQGGDRRAR